MYTEAIQEVSVLRKNKGYVLVLLLFVIVALVVSLSIRLFSQGKETKGDLVILSGSENQELEDMIHQFSEESGISITMEYKGSIDIMNELKSGAKNYDAVWPANSLWITMGDTQKNVENIKSMYATPIVFGIRQSKAEELGFVDKKVSVKDILTAIKENNLTFAMTSATQSNSGACAYFGFLNAMLDKNTPITMEDLKKEDLQKEIKSLLSGVNRSSGSSEWLKDLYVDAEPIDEIDAMVNYESLVITANQELIAMGKEPMYVVYPYDGMVLADSPLGYVNHGDENKEEDFLKFQEYLLTEQSQKQLNDLGRRTGIDLAVEKENPEIWDTSLGINTKDRLSFISLPEKDVITEALNLYQTALRKPSVTVYALDFSGSMEGERYDQLIRAMGNILIQEQAAKYMIQNSADDITIIIPFSEQVMDQKIIQGNDEQGMKEVYDWLKQITPNGSTDIYNPILTGMKILEEYDQTYNKSIVLLSDGESNFGISPSAFERELKTIEKKVPVFSIQFGEASEEQLEQIVSLTNAKLFDGSKDLVQAFRQVRGYN